MEVCYFLGQPFAHFWDHCLHYFGLLLGMGGGFVAWEKDSKFMQLSIEALMTLGAIVLNAFASTK